MIKSLATGLAICFPFYLWFAGWGHPVETAIYLATAGALKFIAEPTGAKSTADWVMILTPVTFGLLVMWLGPRVGLYYPVVINLGLLLVFYSSLSTPTNFVRRIAEKIEKRSLDSVAIKYTGHVTQIWCAIFLLNALIAAFLAWHQMLDEWTLYNGIIVYFVIALLISGEWLMRHRIQRRMRRKRGIKGEGYDR